MGRTHRHDSLRKKVKYPIVHFDTEADFASIKLTSGIEARSYLKDGVLFLENDEGSVIEIQVLNLSELQKKVA